MTTDLRSPLIHSDVEQGAKAAPDSKEMKKELSIDVVDSIDRWDALASDWQRLVRESNATLCLTWDWLRIWWDTFQHDQLTLHILVLRHGDRVVGIAPFYVQRRRWRGILPIRELRFLGTGEPEHEEVASEYLDVMAAPDYRDDVCRAMWRYLTRASTTWDIACMEDVLPDSNVYDGLLPLVRGQSYSVDTHQVGIRYCIAPLASTWEQHLSGMRAGLGKRLLRERRQLEGAIPNWRLVVAEGKDCAEAFATLRHLHGDRWADKGKSGVFAADRFSAFHRALMNRWSADGRARIYLLVGDAPLAALYTFRHQGVEYLYQGGFDVSAAKWSPGFVVQGHAVECAVKGQMTACDFMKGGPGSYKLRFGCSETPMYYARIYSRSPAARLINMASRTKRFLRSKGKQQ